MVLEKIQLFIHGQRELQLIMLVVALAVEPMAVVELVLAVALDL
jgi:hypothetical protein